MCGIDYMRISVTDKCNLRCNYCIPKEGLSLSKSEDILSFDEILRLVKVFAFLGGKKIRLTGGEPLIRRDIVELVQAISSIDGIDEVCLTTNGVLLSDYLPRLKKAGLSQVNISLDTLRRTRFEEITGSDLLRNVRTGINSVLTDGDIILKLNTVIIKGVNDDEIIDFVDYALGNKIELRFIEFMKVTPLWNEKHYLPVQGIRTIIEEKYALVKTDEGKNSPAECYRIENQRIGFIRTHRSNCTRCNRIRVTPVGRLKVCLYEKEGVDVRSMLRMSENDQGIVEILKEKMGVKKDINFSQWQDSSIYMSSVGG